MKRMFVLFCLLMGAYAGLAQTKVEVPDFRHGTTRGQRAEFAKQLRSYFARLNVGIPALTPAESKTLAEKLERLEKSQDEDANRQVVLSREYLSKKVKADLAKVIKLLEEIAVEDDPLIEYSRWSKVAGDLASDKPCAKAAILLLRYQLGDAAQSNLVLRSVGLDDTTTALQVNDTEIAANISWMVSFYLIDEAAAKLKRK